MSGLFGGKKRDKAAEAMQRRMQADAQRDRSELEQDKARIAGSALAQRGARAQLRSKRSGGLKTALGA